MFSFLQPRHVKQGRAFIKDARKLLAYKRDLVSETTAADFEGGIRKLELAVKARDKRAIEEGAQQLDTQAAALTKPVKDAGWRENCEVFLVAIVIALGVRTYFLQPFTIPTGSMQPTLNGILGYPTTEPPPNIVTRLAQKAWLGRTWIDVVAEVDDVIVAEPREIKRFGFLSYTEIQGAKSRYVVNCPKDTLMRYLLTDLRPFKAGEVIARGYWDTGDHVFVDKMSYHFRRPARGDVFVFNTQKVPTRDNRMTGMSGPSQYYIKRLAGLPGDVLRIAPPELFVNGQRAEGASFQRVMSGTPAAPNNGYAGYGNADLSFVYHLLSNPRETYQVPAKSYFALGDNSYHSSDSRDWGAVPEGNLMGHGMFVYWPFTRHWGLIR